ncbi:MAG: twin-arginine translocase TatA/TatE family subunit, partial [Alistipes sp.]|nr:twin-arginine translocase TatA/TatE family subunit [Alistipes sp.]
KKLPELMRGMGRGIREFKDAVNTPSDENNDSL